MQERILDPLSLRLLEGDFKPGEKIKVSANDEELVFQQKKVEFLLVDLVAR